MYLIYDIDLYYIRVNGLVIPTASRYSITILLCDTSIRYIITHITCIISISSLSITFDGELISFGLWTHLLISWGQYYGGTFILATSWR